MGCAGGGVSREGTAGLRPLGDFKVPTLSHKIRDKDRASGRTSCRVPADFGGHGFFDCGCSFRIAQRTILAQDDKFGESSRERYLFALKRASASSFAAAAPESMELAASGIAWAR